MKGVKIGLRSAYYATIMKDEIGSVSYNVPVALPKVQQVQVNPRVSTANVPGDDIVAESLTQCLGADLGIQRAMFTVEEESTLLGRPADSDGGVFGGEFDDPPYVAFGYERTLSDKSSLYVWILKTRFSPSSSTADTKDVERISPQYDTLSASAITRTADGAWIYSKKSNDPKFAATFFSKATLEKLANAASQTYGQPATVEFVEVLPATGTAGVIYIANDTASYWDGKTYKQAKAAE